MKTSTLPGLGLLGNSGIYSAVLSICGYHIPGAESALSQYNRKKLDKVTKVDVEQHKLIKYNF